MPYQPTDYSSEKQYLSRRESLIIFGKAAAAAALGLDLLLGCYKKEKNEQPSNSSKENLSQKDSLETYLKTLTDEDP